MCWPCCRFIYNCKHVPGLVSLKKKRERETFSFCTRRGCGAREPRWRLSVRGVKHSTLQLLSFCFFLCIGRCRRLVDLLLTCCVELVVYLTKFAYGAQLSLKPTQKSTLVVYLFVLVVASCCLEDLTIDCFVLFFFPIIIEKVHSGFVLYSCRNLTPPQLFKCLPRLKG